MSDTSTKRAEEIAYNLQLSGVSGSTWRATEVDASNMLRALAAERDTLRAALKRIEDTDPDEGTPWFHEVARAALKGEKG